MVITGLTRNQLSGSYRTKGSNPLPSATEKPVIKPIAGFLSYAFFKKQMVRAYRIFALLNFGFTILPSAPETAPFGQSKPCFHRLRRSNFRAVIKVHIDICRCKKIGCSFQELSLSLFEYINGFYNPLRPHSHNNGLSPNQAEKYFFI